MILTDEDLVDNPHSAFHSQRAAECFLTPFLTRHKIEFRRTHDSQRLLRLAEPADASLRNELASCVWLSPFGTDHIHPAAHPLVDDDTAKKALAEFALSRPDIKAFG